MTAPELRNDDRASTDAEADRRTLQSVRYQVLGPLTATVDDRTVNLGGPKQRLVLGLLLVDAGRTVSADRLIDRIWDDAPPDGARHTLQAYISELRKLLDDPIEWTGNAYRLMVGVDQIDSARFESLLEGGRQRLDFAPEEAVSQLREALALWRGRPYEDLDNAPGVRPEIARLEELRLVALESRIEADLRLGRQSEVLAELDSLTAEYPLREKFRAQQMLALYRAGRQAEALRAFGRLRQTLVEELGIDPSPDLQNLEEQLLAQDPTLDLPAATERELVFLFTDLEGSTALWEIHADDMNAAVSEHHAAVEAAIASGGGSVFKTTGDGVLAVMPAVGAAVEAASQIQRHLTGRRWGAIEELSTRVAIDLGPARMRDGDYFGPTLNRCARILGVAHGGQVVLSATAAQAAPLTADTRVIDLGERRLKGIGSPQRIFQAVAPGLLSSFPPLRSDGSSRVISTVGFEATTIRGYELRDRIGEGDFGVVYRAYQTSVGREVAIKVIRPEYSNRPAFVRKFEAEAQFVAELEHPHIVSLYDYWRDPDGAYLVMPYMRGASLAQALRRGPWNAGPALRLLDQVGAALSYAHRKGVIHRDLKPANVLLDEDGNAYLSDFGISAHLTDKAGAPLTSSLTYVPPEELRGEQLTPESDIFSFAVLAFELFTGIKPTGRGGLPSISAIRPDLPMELANALQSATDDQPAKRPDRVEDFLRAVRQAIGADVVGVVAEEAGPSSSAPIRNPYKGLRAFQETDAADFHGREGLMDELLEAVLHHRLVAVVGPSGGGKSSVVRAALLPALRAGALPESRGWLITDMFPGSYPFEELEAALLRVAVNDPGALLDELRSDDRGLMRIIKRILPTDDTQLVLVIDQFEEMFSMVDDEETRNLFLGALSTLVNDERGRVRVIITLRADFFDRPLQYSSFGQLVKDGLVPVIPPTDEGLSLAISRPARGVGLDLEPGLVGEIVNDVHGQPGGLPLLQYALTELFQRRQGSVLTSAGYRQTGGVLGALGRRAEETFSDLPPAAQEAAHQLFLRLVTVDEDTDDTRRRVRQSELRGLDVDQAALGTVIQQYASYRLLTFDRDPLTRSPTVEVAHEALLRGWDRLRGWVDERREDLVLHRRLGAAIQEWRDSEEKPSYLLEGGRLEQFEDWAQKTELALSADEGRFLAESRVAHAAAVQRRRRMRRAILAGFGAAAAISLVLAGVAYTNQQIAQSETRSATARELAGSANDVLDEDPERSILLALEAVETTRSAGEPVLPEAMAALQRAVQTSRLELQLPIGESVLALTPNGQGIITDIEHGTADAPIFDAVIFDARTGAEVATLEGQGADAWDIGVSSGGLAAISYNTTDITDHPAVIIWDLESVTPVAELFGPPGGYVNPTFSPDGRLLAVVGYEAGGDPDTVTVFEVASGTSRFVLEGFFTTIAIDGTSLLVPEPLDRKVGIYELGHGEEVGELVGLEAWTLALEPGGRRLATASRLNTVEIWDLETSRRLLSVNTVYPFGVAWSPDGRSVAFWGNEGVIRLVDPNSGDEVVTLAGSERVLDAEFDPRGDRLVSLSFDGQTRIWDITPGGAPALDALSVSGYPHPWSLSPDGSEMITTTDTGTVELLNLSTGESQVLASQQYVHIGRLRAEVSPNWLYIGTVITTLDDKGKVVGLEGAVRDLDSMDVVAELPPCTSPKAFSPDETLVVLDGQFLCVWENLLTPAAGTDLTSRVIEVASGEEILNLGERHIPWAVFNPAGPFEAGRFLVIVVDDDHHLEVYDMLTGTLVASLDGENTPVQRVLTPAFDPGGRYLAYGTASGVAKVYDFEALVGDPESPPALEVNAHVGVVPAVSVRSDGILATAGFDDPKYRLWDFPSGDLLLELETERLADFPSVSFTPDGNYLLYEDVGGVIRKYPMDLDILVDLAKSRATRTLTDAECRAYLHLESCPET